MVLKKTTADYREITYMFVHDGCRLALGYTDVSSDGGMLNYFCFSAPVH